MATGDRKIDIHINRLLSKTDMREYWLNYLSQKVDDTISAFFVGSQGTLDDEKVGLAADGADRFKLDLSNANKVGVQSGQFITIPDENDVSKFIKFENASGIWYHVGMRYCEVPYDQVQLNPKYGNPEYPTLMDSCGEVDAPTVVQNTPGVKIALRLDSITENGVDHSGRNVKVWLAVPVSGIASVAFYEGTSYYSGGYNWVDIPYTGSDGPLGQDTASGPPSTTPGDYRVWIKGVTWRRNTDLSADADYWYAGRLQGVGAGGTPTVFDITSQALLFLITLDRAYDGPPPYPGFGRVISVDAGAVELQTGASGSGDEHNSQLRLSRKADTEGGAVMLELLLPDQDGGQRAMPIAVLAPVSTPGGEVQANEPCTLSGSRVTLTRGGSQDLRATGAWVHWDFTLVEIRETDHDGLYFIDGVSNNYVDVFDMRTGAAPTFSGGDVTGQVTFYRVFFSVSATPRIGGDELAGSRFVGIDGAGNDHDVKFYPCGNTEMQQLYDSEDPDPNLRGVLNEDGVWQLQGLRVTPRSDGPTYTTTAPALKYIFDIDASATLAQDYPASTRIGRVVTSVTQEECERLEASGRRARGHRFVEEFMYHYDFFTASPGSAADALRPHWRHAITSGGSGGYIRATDDFSDVLVAVKGGRVVMKSTDLIGAQTTMKGPMKWFCRNISLLKSVNMYCNFRMGTTSDVGYYIGLENLAGDVRTYFYLDGNFNKWRLVVDDQGTINVGEPLPGSPLPTYQTSDDVHMYLQIDPWASTNGLVRGTISHDDGGTFRLWQFEAAIPGTTAFESALFRPYFQVKSEAASACYLYPTFIEVWDNDVQGGWPGNET